ncbi:MAG: Glyoxalase 2 domain containing protein [Actinomycetia bacterium]|nr:Glyoxalase 2 domain containing protein [Actinomycetes bacterium]
MASRFYHLVIDAHEPLVLAQFWAAALDHRILYQSDDGVIVGSDEHHYPGLRFVPVPEPKTIKNRLHIDLDPDDQDTEVECLITLGARRVDVGQAADVSWVVLADPKATSSACSAPTDPSSIDTCGRAPAASGLAVEQRARFFEAGAVRR